MANGVADPVVASGREDEAALVGSFRATILHSLVAAGDRDAVLEMLDDDGMDEEELNRRDSDGLTPLHLAIQGCRLSLSGVIEFARQRSI